MSFMSRIMPHSCDSCREKLSISHALDYKKGFLVTTSHNNLNDGVSELARKSFISSYVRDPPLSTMVVPCRA